MTVKQVGGTHYLTRGKQHWDLADEFDVPYLEGTASKYVTRWRRKGTPIQDLEKAVSYLEKRLESKKWPSPPRLIGHNAVIDWCFENDIGPVETQVIVQIHVLGTPRAIRDAVRLLHGLLEEHKERIQATNDVLGI